MIRQYTFDTGGNGCSTSVGGFLEVDVEIIVGEYAATDGADPDRFFGHSHLIHDFCDEFVHYTVGTSRAIVHRIGIQQARPFVGHGAFLDDFFFRHDYSLLKTPGRRKMASTILTMMARIAMP